jgi:hypothetical protein
MTKPTWKPSNLKEAIALAERYETITLEEIMKNKKPFYTRGEATKANDLTGFSFFSTCTLCLAVNRDCYQCIYGSTSGCIYNSNYSDTYHAIKDATRSKALLKAYRDRAVVLRELIAKYT